MGSEFTIRKRDGLRLDHDRKRNGVRVHQEKERCRQRLPEGRAMGLKITITKEAMG